jgi:hypothetical protein
VELWFDSQLGQEIFLLEEHPDLLWTHPPSCSVGAMGFFPGSKVVGHKAGHSSPPNAEVKNEWIRASLRGGPARQLPTSLH